MPGVLASCEDVFDTTDLYAVLGVSRTASQAELKRGYHRVSLQVHPDRVAKKDKKAATEKFQVLGKVYSILSDKDKRAIYDESGEVDDEDDIQQDRDWYEHWRVLFAAITVDDIKQFEKKYKESAEELKDLKAAYEDYEGDMDLIIENVLCATVDDEKRFRKLLNDAIKAKEVPKYKAFTSESSEKKKARKQKAAEEAEEAEELREELGIKEGSSLTALIKQRQESRAQEMDSFFSHLEAKYAAPPKKKNKKGK